MLLRLLDWLCARWLRRYEGDLPVSKAAMPAKAETMKRHLEIMREIGAPPDAIAIAEEAIRQAPLADALSKPIVLPDVPKQTVTIAGEWDPNNISVSAEASVDIGKPGGWSTGGKGGYWKDKGAAVMGWLQWKGKR
jgi:hypothetical protein